MTAPVQRLATAEPVLCAVCRRRSAGIGYAPRMGAPILWLCDRPACIALGKEVYRMSADKLDAFERAALDDAGDAAGAFLDEIGVTDLALLTPEQWQEFRVRMLTGYEEALRRRITEGVAPF